MSIDSDEAEYQKYKEELNNRMWDIRQRIDASEIAMRKVLWVLANIADKYDANGLDDDARKYWGVDNINTRDPKKIELYTGRGGLCLLTLQDCFDARDALNYNTKDN